MTALRDPRMLAVLLGALALPACGQKDAPKPDAHGEGEAHDHTAPHGGELLELGEEEAHLELMHDHDGGNVTVYAYGKTLKEPVAIAKPVITIQMKDGSMAEVGLTPMDAKADGTALGWKGQHAGLISDPWNGRIRVVIAGKTFQSPLEGEGHAHK